MVTQYLELVSENDKSQSTTVSFCSENLCDGTGIIIEQYDDERIERHCPCTLDPDESEEN